MFQSPRSTSEGFEKMKKNINMKSKHMGFMCFMPFNHVLIKFMLDKHKLEDTYISASMLSG